MAEPPAGSDLKPVMGDSGLPILGHMVEMFRGGPDFWLHLYRTRGRCPAPRFADHSDGGCAGPRRDSGDLLQPQQGLLAAGLGAHHRPFFNRGLMLLDFDEHMYHRRIMQEAFVRTRLAGYTEQVDKVVSKVDRQRLGGQRRALPALSGDEGAHARHRLDGVHGPRAGHRPGTGDQGEQGVHRHHARGQRHHPHQRAAVHVVARTESPRIPGELLRGARQGAPRQGRLATC